MKGGDLEGEGELSYLAMHVTWRTWDTCTCTAYTCTCINIHVYIHVHVWAKVEHMHMYYNSYKYNVHMYNICYVLIFDIHACTCIIM